MGKYNKLLQLDFNLQNPVMPEIVAHTRGKTIWTNDGPTVYELGASMQIKTLIASMKSGSKDGEVLFMSNASYTKTYLSGNTASPLIHSVNSNISEEEEETDSEFEIEDGGLSDEDDDMIQTVDVNVGGKQMNISAAVTKYCNGGRSSLGCKSRQSRFYGALDNKVGLYDTECRASEDCYLVNVNDTVEGYFTRKKDKDAVPTLENNNILFISVALIKGVKKMASATTMFCSKNRYPARSVCLHHDSTARFWVKTAGGIENCSAISLTKPVKKQ